MRELVDYHRRAFEDIAWAETLADAKRIAREAQIRSFSRGGRDLNP